MRSGLFVTDMHTKAGKEEHRSLTLVKAFASKMQPYYVVNGGDIGEWEFLASFNKEKLKKILGQTYSKEYDAINRDLDFFDNVCTGEHHLCLGNHDERVDNAIDSLPTLDGLVNWEVQVAPKHDIQIYHQIEQPLKIGKLHFLHGNFTNKYHTAKHLDRYSANVVYGHMHEFQTFAKVLWAHNEQIQAWCIACLTDLAPEWKKGCPTHWQNGFAIFYIHDDGRFNFYPINIVNDAFFAPDGSSWDLRKAGRLLEKLEKDAA